MLDKKKFFSQALINTLISLFLSSILLQILNFAFKKPPLSFEFIITIVICIPIFFISNLNKAYKELTEKMLSYEKITEVVPIDSNYTYSNFDIIVLPEVAKFYAILNRDENCVLVTIIFNNNSRPYTYDKVSKEKFFKHYDILNA